MSQKGLKRYAARRDVNDGIIVDAARQVGFKVFRTSELGDCLVQYGGLCELWEIKSVEGKLTKAQLLRKQAGLKARIVRTVDDVLLAKRQMIDFLKGRNYGIPVD